MIAQHARKRKGVTHQGLADLLKWEDGRQVQDALASGRSLGARKATAILKALRKIRPHFVSRDPSRRPDTDDLIDVVLASIDPSLRVPPVLIPKWTVRALAEYIADQMSQLRPGTDAKRREANILLLQRVFERTASDMAQSFYRHYSGHWVDDSPADRVLQQYGGPSSEPSLLSNKEK
jgi:hypothetical protein